MEGSPTPQWIGPYELVRELARGGMGVVYRAHDPRADREVALKVLRAGRRGHARERLVREARALAALRHPNVLRVHDAGEAPEGPYIALELIEDGRDLGAVLAEQGPLAPVEAVEIAAKLADALQACHDAGVVHRDLKPANVLRTPDGRVLLTDFGLALQPETSLDRLSQTGAILGTPGFFSPEQARGEREIGPGSDVYGLGATLYALLTGVPPVRGATLIEVVIATEERSIPAPSALQPEVPPWLDRVVLRCLERAPDRRFAGAREVAEALRAHGEDGARGPRRPAPALAAVGAAIAVAVAAAVGLREPPPPDPAPAPTTPATAATASSPPAIVFEPPPIGSAAKLLSRFEQSYRGAGVRQILHLEIASRGRVVESGRTSTIDGTVTRVRGRVTDMLNDLQFFSDQPERTSRAAKLVVGDALAMEGKRLRTTFAHNGPEVSVVGLPAQVRIGGQGFSPSALVTRRLRPTHGCFPIGRPDEAEWIRTTRFEIRQDLVQFDGQVRLRCRRLSSAGGTLDLRFSAETDDATWAPGSLRVTSFRLDGRARVRDGWIESSQVDASLDGRQPRGTPFTFTIRTRYEIAFKR